MSSHFDVLTLYMYLFIYNTPYGSIQVTGSLVDRKDGIQGVIDRDTLFCLLGELISHAEEETSGHKGFQKKRPTDCPSIPRPGQTLFFDPIVLTRCQMRRGHREVTGAVFSVSLSLFLHSVSVRPWEAWHALSWRRQYVNLVIYLL